MTFFQSQFKIVPTGDEKKKEISHSTNFKNLFQNRLTRLLVAIS